MTRDIEDTLREAFEARADRVEVSPDALPVIRGRLGRRTRRRRTLAMSFASIATGAAATVTAVVVGLSSCLPSQTDPPVGTAPAPPTVPASPTAPDSTAPPAGVEVRVPVYFTRDAGNRIVLYREYHVAPVAADSLAGRIELAVSTMLRGQPFDPDYSSPWPRGAAVLGVRVEGDVAVVDLAGAGTNSVASESAVAAVQQLVHTVTGVGADQRVELAGVRLLLDGRAVDELWGHVPAGGVLTRAAALTTLAQVWLISPQQGDTVGRSFQVHVAGAVPEATVQLWVRDASGAVVKRQTITLSIGGPQRGEARATVTLEPGRYTLEAFFESLADGSVQALDDHAIVVR